MRAYKGFDRTMHCIGFKYEVGQSYTKEGEIKLCFNGFHACEHPLAVLCYYPPSHSRYAEVDVSGYMDRDANQPKLASENISVVEEITVDELILRAVDGQYSPLPTVIKGAGEISKMNGIQTISAVHGIYGAAQTSGDRGVAAASGDMSGALSSGTKSSAVSTGWCSVSVSIGAGGSAVSTGDLARSKASGRRGIACTSGDMSLSEATGEVGVAMSTGWQGRASGSLGCALFLVRRAAGTGTITHVWSGIVGANGIEPDTAYTLDDSGRPIKA